MGWKYEELYKTINRFSEFKKIVGIDVTEMCPHYDPAGVTALMGAKVIREMLFLLKRCLNNVQ